MRLLLLLLLFTIFRFIKPVKKAKRKEKKLRKKEKDIYKYNSLELELTGEGGQMTKPPFLSTVLQSKLQGCGQDLSVALFISVPSAVLK